MAHIKVVCPNSIIDRSGVLVHPGIQIIFAFIRVCSRIEKNGILIVSNQYEAYAKVAFLNRCDIVHGFYNSSLHQRLCSTIEYAVFALGRNHERLLRQAGVDPVRLAMLRSFDPRSGAHPEDVEDPYYGTIADFEETFTVITAALPGLHDWVDEQLGAS